MSEIARNVTQWAYFLICLLYLQTAVTISRLCTAMKIIRDRPKMHHRLKRHVEVLYMGAASILRLHFFVHAYIQTHKHIHTYPTCRNISMHRHDGTEYSKSVRSEGLIEVTGYYVVWKVTKQHTYSICCVVYSILHLVISNMTAIFK